MLWTERRVVNTLCISSSLMKNISLSKSIFFLYLFLFYAYFQFYLSCNLLHPTQHMLVFFYLSVRLSTFPFVLYSVLLHCNSTQHNLKVNKYTMCTVRCSYTQEFFIVIITFYLWWAMFECGVCDIALFTFFFTFLSSKLNSICQFTRTNSLSLVTWPF